MPEPIIRGMKGGQQAAPVNAGVLFPPIEGREPGQGEDTLVFESWALKYRLQLNSPDVKIDLTTGTKSYAKNEVVLFDGALGDTFGVYVASGPNSERDVKAIFGSKSFGPPFKANIWLRSERQKLSVEKAVTALTEQLRARPDLIATVSKRLKELAGAGRTFSLPGVETEPVAPPPDEDLNL